MPSAALRAPFLTFQYVPGSDCLVSVPCSMRVFASAYSGAAMSGAVSMSTKRSITRLYGAVL